MKHDNRKIFVIFVDDKTKEAYDKLKTGKFEDKELYEFINRAIDDLKKNPRVGIHLPKRLIPKEYIQKHGVNNLYKYDLPNGWRLIYTIKGSEVEILSVILEWFDHKNYGGFLTGIITITLVRICKVNRLTPHSEK